MTGAVRAVIDTEALRHNLGVVRQTAPGARVMAVVKANAYGHDVATIAAAIPDADAFAVARPDEGAHLRATGCLKPIVVLGGAQSAADLDLCAGHDLDLVVHAPEQLAMLEGRRGTGAFNVWLKFDSGMHRLGFDERGFAVAYQRLADLPHVHARIRLMTHLACADDRENPMTARQIESFARQLRDVTAERSIANSGGLLGWPAARADWVRPGLMLYGVSPFPGTTGAELGLKPVMTLRAPVIAVKDVARGDRVGYGATWEAGVDTRIAIVALGYGDGYPWRAATGGEAAIAGRRYPLAGRVSMDMVAVDLGAGGIVTVGDQAVLWGDGLPVEEVAAHAGTIPYELVCAISQRVAVTTKVAR